MGAKLRHKTLATLGENSDRSPDPVGEGPWRPPHRAQHEFADCMRKNFKDHGVETVILSFHFLKTLQKNTKKGNKYFSCQ